MKTSSWAAVFEVEDSAMFEETTYHAYARESSSEKTGHARRNMQMPRMIRSIWTPACEASQSFMIICLSARRLNWQLFAAGPSRLLVFDFAIDERMMLSRKVTGQ
jgi:hypothetical protein